MENGEFHSDPFGTLCPKLSETKPDRVTFPLLIFTEIHLQRSKNKNIHRLLPCPSLLWCLENAKEDFRAPWKTPALLTLKMLENEGEQRLKKANDRKPQARKQNHQGNKKTGTVRPQAPPIEVFGEDSPLI